MIQSGAALFLLSALTLAMSGCATLPSRESTTAKWTVRHYLLDQIVDTRTGTVIPFETLISELSKAQVVYLGETHTSIEDHRIQLKIAEALHGSSPDLMLAMEMFPRESQEILDRYSQGQLSEEEFLKEVEWEKVWGFPFPLYRSILSWAAEKRVPLVGLNASRDVVKTISRGGLTALSPKDRSRVAEDFNLTDAEHRRYVEEQYEQHVKGGIRDVNSFYEAQLAWEETMAETLARILAQRGKDTRIAVLIGRGHAIHRFGVPLRAARRFDHAFKIVLPMPIDYRGSVANPGMADYVWITQPPRQPGRGRLGVMVRALEKGKGLEVLAVAPESPAETSGIQAGDVILVVNGVEIETIEDLQGLIAERRIHHEIILRRGRQQLKMEVSIPEE
ncbi:MAG: ChaN family lipoprotein [Syntrophobacteraceae bacterium]|nr:ChaN family lipoprotein [Syntrophobacteraceae bacterium]